jgi:hypothetical protein
MLLRTPLYHNTIISVLIPVAFALPKMPRGKPSGLIRNALPLRFGTRCATRAQNRLSQERSSSCFQPLASALTSSVWVIQQVGKSSCLPFGIHALSLPISGSRAYCHTPLHLFVAQHFHALTRFALDGAPDTA